MNAEITAFDIAVILGSIRACIKGAHADVDDQQFDVASMGYMYALGMEAVLSRLVVITDDIRLVRVELESLFVRILEEEKAHAQ